MNQVDFDIARKRNLNSIITLQYFVYISNLIFSVTSSIRKLCAANYIHKPLYTKLEAHSQYYMKTK